VRPRRRRPKNRVFAPHPVTPPRDVALVHGLLLSGWVMAPLARHLRRCGWRCHVFSYPSRRDSLAAHADSLAAFLQRRGIARCHFAAHSMGGLVVREYLARGGGESAGGGCRSVALGTPFGGSSLAAVMARKKFGKWILGAAATALTTAAPPWPPQHALGVIAGQAAFTLSPAARLFGAPTAPGDGVVLCSETGTPNTAAAVTVNCTHTAMLFRREVMRLAERFLAAGVFDGEDYAGGDEPVMPTPNRNTPT